MRIRGWIMDESRNPVSGATVDVYAAAAGTPGGAAEDSTTSDANGQFAVTGLTAAAKDTKVDSGGKGYWLKGLAETVISRLGFAIEARFVHQSSDPATPEASEISLYQKSGLLYLKDEAGTVVSIPVVLNRDVTVQEVVNDVTETTVYTFAVPANSLSTNRMLRLTLIGDVLNNSGGPVNLTVRVKFGGTVIGLFGPFSVAADASRRPVSVVSSIIAQNATNAQRTWSEYWSGDPGGAGAPPADAGQAGGRTNVHNALALDSTGALTLLVSVEWASAASTLSFRMHSTILELV